MHTLAVVTPLVFNSNGLTSFLIKNIVPIILVVIGILILSRANKGNVSGTMTTVLIVIIGLVIIGGAGALYAFGEQIANLIFA